MALTALWFFAVFPPLLFIADSYAVKSEGKILVTFQNDFDIAQWILPLWTSRGRCDFSMSWLKLLTLGI